MIAFHGPAVPRKVRPSERARGLPVGVARCGSVLMGVRVRGHLADRRGGGLAAWRASSFEYDTRARSRYASCVPPTGRRMATSVGCGAMAQLVARLHGMQKVRGSNPLSSTQVRGRFRSGNRPFSCLYSSEVQQQRDATPMRVTRSRRRRDELPTRPTQPRVSPRRLEREPRSWYRGVSHDWSSGTCEPVLKRSSTWHCSEGALLPDTRQTFRRLRPKD